MLRRTGNRKKWMFIALCAIVVATLASSGCFRRKPVPNAIFLIVVDTLRPDRLSCYGYEDHETPNIDRLAAAGTTFTQARSVASWTRPSMAAMLTSLYPSQLGLVESPALPGERFAWRDRRVQEKSTIPGYVQTLAEILRNAGFETAAFVNQPALNTRNGFERGFTDWYYPIGPGDIVALEPRGKHIQQNWGPTLKVAERNDRLLAQEFERWLGQRDPRVQMFVWLHLLTPHLPYDPNPQFMPDPIAGRPPLSESDRYDAEVRAVDDIVGGIVHSIENRVGMDRALIIFTADHGEAFGEHGMYEHGHTLHDEVIRVPLIVVSSSFDPGAREEDYASTIDLMPTILDVIQRPEIAPTAMQGTTIVPRIFAGEVPPDVYAEGMLYGSTERAVISDGYKLMFDEQERRWTLFDVSADPNELTDMAQERPDRAQRMAKLLRDTYSRLVEDFRRFQSQGSAEEHAIDPSDDLDALRSLGYIDTEDSEH